MLHRHTLAALALCGVAGAPLPAAAYTLSISGPATAHRGDTVSFNYNVDNADGLAALQINLTYDSSVLTFDSAASTQFTGFLDSFDAGVGTTVSAFSWDGLSGTDQTLFTIAFKVSSAALYAPTDLGYGTVDLYDVSLAPVDPSLIDATGTARLTVQPVPIPAAGPLLFSALMGLAAFGRRKAARSFC